jgi:hypothetical protein
MGIATYGSMVFSSMKQILNDVHDADVFVVTLFRKQWSHHETKHAGYPQIKNLHLSRWETESVCRVIKRMVHPVSCHSCIRRWGNNMVSQSLLCSLVNGTLPLNNYRHTHTDSRRDSDRLWLWGVYEYTVSSFVSILYHCRAFASSERPIPKTLLPSFNSKRC